MCAYGMLDLGFIFRPPGSGRQNARAIMGGHVGICSVYLRIIQTRLDDRDLGVVWNEKTRNSVDGCKRSGVRCNPVGKALGPRGLCVGKVLCSHHSNKYLSISYFTGQPVDDHRHAIAGVVDEQLVAADVALAHRHRQPAFEIAVELTEAAVAITVRMLLDVLFPQDRQRHMLALELAMQLRPVGLAMTTMATLRARSPV